MRDYLQLYDAAWGHYHARCLWNLRRFDDPTPDQAGSIIDALKQHGDMAARQLAEDLADAIVVAQKATSSQPDRPATKSLAARPQPLLARVAAVGSTGLEADKAFYDRLEDDQ